MRYRIIPEFKLPLVAFGLTFVVVTIVFMEFFWWFWLLLFLLLWFFRYDRDFNVIDPLSIISPLDGVLISHESDLYSDSSQPAIVLNIIHRWHQKIILFSPIEGKVVKIKDFSYKNKVKLAIKIITDESENIEIHLYGAKLGLCKLNIQPGVRVGSGQYIGFFVFLKKIRIFITDNSKYIQKTGKIKGLTQIATLTSIDK
jgi:hypothetical protein